MTRASVDLGALCMGLNMLRRGTEVQQEAARSIDVTVDRDEFARQVSVPPTHSGLYWGHFINNAGAPWQGPIRFTVVKTKGKLELAAGSPREDWLNLVWFHRIPHQEYELPEDLDNPPGQATMNWD